MLPRKLVDIQRHQQWRAMEKSLHQKEQTQKYCQLKENELFKFQITLHLYAL